MKKIFVGVLIFGVLSFLATGALIKISLQNNDGEIGNHGNSGEHGSKEKTLELSARFDENDIKLEEVKVQYDKVSGEIKVPQVSGLKDKSVEEKINNEINDAISAKINEIFGNIVLDGEEFYTDTNGSSSANFSNVLSFRTCIYSKVKGEYHTDYINFNYELVNGTKLKFEDLFTKDADLYTIIRKAFYRILASEEVLYYGGYYDEEKDEWVEAPYVPDTTEDEINRKINKFINNSYEPFYFNSQRVYLDNEYRACIEFKDIADEVTIYDKYLTDESIYERDDIGLKNLWTCSIPCREAVSFQEYGFLEDNFYYDITGGSNYFPSNDEYPYKDYLEKVNEETLKSARKQVEEYRKIAKENPDKFYIVFVSPSAGRVSNGKYDYESNTRTYKHSNIITSQINTSLLVASGENAKEDAMNDLLDKYRYYNIGFYGGLAKLLYNTDAFAESKEDITMYNAKAQKEITSIGELFKDGVDYEKILDSNLMEELETMDLVDTPEKLNKNMQEAKFYISSSSIYAKVPDCEYPLDLLWLDDEETEELLNIYD